MAIDLLKVYWLRLEYIDSKEIAEAIVAEDNQEWLENDDTDMVDQLVNLHSGISKVRNSQKWFARRPSEWSYLEQ
ncbi:hypothetical protein RSAG8_09241, partial [Rhizoctonia solani AG-8 WAC10335]